MQAPISFRINIQVEAGFPPGFRLFLWISRALQCEIVHKLSFCTKIYSVFLAIPTKFFQTCQKAFNIPPEGDFDPCNFHTALLQCKYCFVKSVTTTHPNHPYENILRKERLKAEFLCFRQSRYEADHCRRNGSRNPKAAGTWKLGRCRFLAAARQEPDSPL